MILLIGDAQGCAQALERLLLEAGFSPSRDRLVMLGDLVNRGPDSLGVLRLLRGLGNAATCLLGNHDLHLLAVAHGARKLRKGDTFADILQAPDSAEWLAWLRQQPLVHFDANWLCVHAGVMPQWSTQQTLALAAEVQTLLRGPDLPDFLHLMYSDLPDRWSPELQGTDRMRLVVNTFTRIRHCSAEGVMDLKTKEGANDSPPGFMPWFAIPGRQTAQQPIAFGHWSTLGLVNQPNLLGLDTGCVWGGPLTAARVDGGRRELLQVPCSQAQVPGAPLP